MILSVSTSSPVVSVALAGTDGQVAAARSVEAPWAAGGALGSLIKECLEEAQATVRDLTCVIADEGPGGFTGVRVGVSFAKALAWSLGIPLHLVSAFDLIDPEGDAFVPMKKGEWLSRPRLGTVTKVEGTAPPAGSGYGRDVTVPKTPDARLAFGLASLDVDPVAALPAYYAEPSISMPKDARVLGGSKACP